MLKSVFKKILLFSLLFFASGLLFFLHGQTAFVPESADVAINPFIPSGQGGDGDATIDLVTPGTAGTPGTPGTGVTPGTPGTPGTTGTVGPSLNINFNQGDEEDVGVAIQLLFIMTLLTLSPSMIIMMTCFTRVAIVLGFIRTAVGTQSAPTNQIIIGLALFITFYIMGPTFDDIYREAVVPYMDEQIKSKEALFRAGDFMKEFMLTQTESKNVDFFLGISGLGPMTAGELPMRVVVPSFILSELKTAFTMGFLIYVPFLVIDFLAASILMSMGMMMMPPVIIAMPFKILLFVLVDGWYIIISSLVRSF